MTLRTPSLALLAGLLACLALAGVAQAATPAEGASTSAKAKAFKVYSSCQSKPPFKASRRCGFDSSTQAKVSLLVKSNIGPYFYKFCAKIPGDHSCEKTNEPLTRAYYNLTVTLIGGNSLPVKFTVFAKRPEGGSFKRIARHSMRVVK